MTILGGTNILRFFDQQANAMPLFKALLPLPPFRLIAVGVLAWLVFGGPALAWQNNPYAPYAPYPNYAPPVYFNPYPNQMVPNRMAPVNYQQRPAYAAPVNYNPYPQPNYYPGYYYPPQPRFAAPYPAPAPASLNNSVVEPTVKNITSNSPDKAPQDQSTQVSTPDVSTTKQEFIDELLPYIEQENQRLSQRRERASSIIQQLDSGADISEQSTSWLKKTAKRYRIDTNPVTDPEARQELLAKIDIIPASLTLAQAANESAWGRSRFATEANNLFGIWTYDESKGLVPENRDEDKKHLIRVFDHYGESVAYYMHTLNSHPAYDKLREIRQQQRNEQQLLDGHEMAEGLEKYSARGELYIRLIQDLIRQNQWAQLDDASPSA